VATLNPVLRDFWETPARNRILYGGRSSSKSTDAAGYSIFLATRCKIRVLCCRQYQCRIADSVYTLLKSRIYDFKLQDSFKITNNSIICTDTGSEFMFYGISRNIDEIRSIEDIDILWIEEAHLLTESQWDVLEPTIRKQGSQVWIVFNPRLRNDFIWQRFVVNPPPNTIIRHINYTENPFLSQTMRDIIEAARLEDEEKYNHIYLGEPLEDDEQAVIRRSHVMAAIDGHIKLGITPSGMKRIGFDVADSGEDYCATVSVKGSLAYSSDLWKAKEDELLKSCTRVWADARQTDSLIIYDAIGVGAASGAKFNELNENYINKVRHAKFFAGGAPNRPDSYYGQTGISNRDFFSNIKAQAWWNVGDRFRNTYNAITQGQVFKEDEMIFIDAAMPNLSKLIDELCTPKRDFDLNGRVKVESKKDLAKREIASPNCFVAGTLIQTRSGQVPIETLKLGDNVLTPMGESIVIYLHKNQASVISKAGLIGTPEHKIFTWNKGWVSLGMLSLCDKIETYKIGGFKWRVMNRLYGKAKCSQFSTQVDIIVQEGTEEKKTLAMSDFYTGGFGLKTTGLFLKIITSIILTMIGAITELKTLSLLPEKTINGNTCLSGSSQMNIEKKITQFWQMHKKRLKSGINQLRDGNGILSTCKGNLINENLKNMFALSAGAVFFQGEHGRLLLAHQNVQQRQAEKKQRQRVSQNADVAGKHLPIQNLKEEMKTEDVQENAHTQSKKTEVYNITLDKHNVYYANGVLVKNCADAFISAYAPGVSTPMVINL